MDGRGVMSCSIYVWSEGGCEYLSKGQKFGHRLARLVGCLLLVLSPWLFGGDKQEVWSMEDSLVFGSHTPLGENWIPY